MKTNRLFIFFIFISTCITSAQELVFEHYNEVNGLSHNSVRSIVQDSKGFLWIGTFGGVNRFDGYDFKTFEVKVDDPNFLNSDDILEIVADKHDNLWIATDFGLTKYNIPTHTFKTYHSNKNKKNAIVGDKIRSIFIDNSDRLWVGTMQNGICYFNKKEERFYKVNADGAKNIRSIYQTSDGKIWFTTFNKGVFSLTIDEKNNISNFKNYKLSPKKGELINDSDAYFILEDKLHELYVGTKDGLYQFNNIDNEFSLIHKDNSTDYFRCYTIAPDGKYWFGTLNGIIECESIEDIKNNTFNRYIPDIRNTSSLVNNYILSLYFDQSGILWIGTENGLDKLDPYENQFKSIKANFTSSGNIPVISSFAKTYDNKVLVGTNSNGLYIKYGNAFKQILKSYKRISSIYTIDNIEFFIGLWSGKVLNYNLKTNSVTELNVGVKSSPISTFYKISDTKLLIGSVGEGLIEFDLKKRTSLKINPELDAMQDINKIVPDKEDVLWLATEEGVVKYNIENKETRHYKFEENKRRLSNNKIKDIIIDGKGTVWAGTRKGLNYYDSLRDDFFLKENPVELKNSWITDMTTDIHGCLWLNMNYNKIVKYIPEKNEYRSFHINNGVRSNLINKRGFLQYDNTRIYIGGDKDIIYFSPIDIKENTNAPKPLITDFKIQNKEVLPGIEIDNQIVLNKDLNYNNSVELKYRNRNFSIKFAIPSYANERLNTYEYKLEGFDDTWNTTTSNSRTVQYTNLYPDDYILRVKASNNNGYWSDVSTYNISISSPFWLTYQFFILVLVLLSVFIYFLRKQIKYRIQLKQELLLEKVKRERDEKLNNEKLRFFTNISHELRTPLTLILGPAKQLLNAQVGGSQSKHKIGLIHQNANRLLRLVNQILDFRRAETGELKLKVSEVDVIQSTKSVFYSFIELAQSKNINFNFNTEDDAIMCWVDIDKLNKMLYNLLSNAMKFTDNHGNVDLFIGIGDKKNKTLIIEVSDDGIGIPSESQEKIFSRFYQAKNSMKNTTGTGIGLSLVKALVEIHKGLIKVESETKKGSVFTIELPVYKNAFTTEEIQEVDTENSQKNTEEIIKDAPLVLNQTESKTKNLNIDVKHKILVIEDNSELRKYAVDYLSDFFTVYEAENGKEGLEICKKIKPVLCVVDVMMPVMDGFKFVEALKNDENISHIAVILLTALAENENRIKGYKIGVDGYLVKPFDPALLKSRIDNVIKIHFDLKQRFSGVAESDVMTLAHSQIDIDLVSRIKEVIETNLNEPNLSPSFVSDEMAMSSSKLYRKIKQLTDLSPNEFIRTIRLKKSAQLLKTKNYNVSEVSDMVGFNDPLYFSRVFKKQFGYAPSKLLK
ncbi:two-component regulator propeller domain-containing protein [uncultured Algibacter sp.]|uniref:two-component regulator propeller domain-containing protein n=1 Tax=uncultured Algibacter sp. TaxID=298659 RepID=UPI00262F2B76|nr:two-component regulator propeller domain-containing protein [uncultured Algibacter sp.]